MTDYTISKWFSQNDRKDSVSVYIPKRFAKAHKLLESPYVIITNKTEGILIKPLQVAVEDVD